MNNATQVNGLTVNEMHTQLGSMYRETETFTVAGKTALIELADNTKAGNGYGVRIWSLDAEGRRSVAKYVKHNTLAEAEATFALFCGQIAKALGR